MGRDTADDSITECEARQGGITPTELNPRLMHDIQTALSRLVSKASQLIENVTTNVAESWMHIRCKYDGGKVINRSQSGSWEHRCMGAGLQQNLGKEWGPEMWRQMTKSSPNKVFSDTARHSAKQVESDQKRKAKEEVKAKRRSSKYSSTDDTVAARKSYSRNDEGDLPEEPDISPDNLEQLKRGFYQTKVTVNYIERHTLNQADNELWMIERRKRITASNVGSISKMRQTTKRSKKVEALLYSNFRGNIATRYGLEKEESTRQQYKTYMTQNGHPNLKIEECGLFVSLENPWLAASPDGLVHDPDTAHPLGLVEIKNPYSVRQLSIAEALKTPSFCLELKKDEDTYKLKRKHDFYYQIQCQLYCTDRKWCDFVLRTDVDMHVQRIEERDTLWWNSNIPKLQKFYFSSLLPELTSPRFRRGGIRDPPN